MTGWIALGLIGCLSAFIAACFITRDEDISVDEWQ